MHLVATYYPPSQDTPNASVDAMRFLVLISTIKKISPDYNLLNSNCYYFVLMAVELMKSEFGGYVRAEGAVNPLGKVAGKYPLAEISVEHIQAKIQSAREIYVKDWEAFVEKVGILPFCFFHMVLKKVNQRDKQRTKVSHRHV